MTEISPTTTDEYTKMLENFGLSASEAKVYLATLELGQSTVTEIAERANVQRTFVYDILDALNEEGLISAVEIRGVRHFSAISIDRFLHLQEDKLKKFKGVLPELKAIEKSVGDRPKVRYYEGGEGIKLALEDTLNQPTGGEILAYATAEGFYASEPEWMKGYLERRKKKKIFCRAIGPDTPVNRTYTDRDKEQLRQTRLIPAKRFPFTNEIDIYGNKTLIMSLQGELLAVIIESESVARTQRMIFELAWLGAKNAKYLEEK